MKRQNLIHILLGIVCIGLLPDAQAVLPPPDGGYPGGNTAEGQNALLSLTTGGFNTALGFLSLQSNTEGQFNTGNGAGTLLANTADQNTATGAGALLSNTTGAQNTANGAFALFSNITGNSNTANGRQALFSNTGGGGNTANGYQALENNTTGSNNTATGLNALFSNTTGGSNIALGAGAGLSVTSANNVIAIGSAGENLDGRCYIGNIRGSVVGNGDGINVIIDSDGQLGTSNVSSRRLKKDIKPMDQTSEAILALKPVTFHYKNLDTKKAENTPQFGLIAEDVAEVNPNLVIRDKAGQVTYVRYDAVNAMLLNEFLKEHRKNEEQQATIARLIATDTRQQKQIEALMAALQKVSAQLEASKPAPQVVNNP